MTRPDRDWRNIRDHDPGDDPLAPARGVFLGIALAACMWGGIGLYLWLG